MIHLEIVITLVAMMMAFVMVVYMLPKSGIRKKRYKQDAETLELARYLKCDTRKPENLASIGLKPLFIRSEKPNAIKKDGNTAVVFAVIIFCAFAGWAFYLMALQLIQPAGLTFAFALTCVFGLLYAKRKIAQTADEYERLSQALYRYEHELSEPPREVVKKAEPAVRVAPQAESIPDRLNQLYQLAQEYSVVPEDLSLKRHFLTQLMAEVEDSFDPRPTDSTLKRHHDTMLYAELERRLQEMSAVAGVKPVESVVVEKVPVANVVKKTVEINAIPEDSTLRRHVLSQLHTAVEESFGSRPTDSTLRRHFDAMVEAVFEARVQALSAKVQRSVKAVRSTFASVTATPVVTRKDVEQIPEDSTLRRHFVTQLRTEIAEGIGLRPSDSTLRRHYDAMVEAQLEERLHALTGIAQQKSELRTPPVKIAAVTGQVKAEEHYEHLPEDSALRRHFLTELRTRIVAKMPQKPTDFNLLRHYNAMVEAAMQKELEEHYL